MIKFTSFLPKISPIAGYYLQFLAQSGKFSLFFLSPHNYAKVSRSLSENRKSTAEKLDLVLFSTDSR